MSADSWDDPPHRSWINAARFWVPLAMMAGGTYYGVVTMREPNYLIDPAIIPMMFGGMFIMFWISHFSYMATGKPPKPDKKDE